MKIAIINERRSKKFDEIEEKYLLIMFHGYGADGMNLLPIVDWLSIKNCIFIAPDSPNLCTLNPFGEIEDSSNMGRKWFDIDPTFNQEVLFERVQAIEKPMIDFIEEQLEKYQIKHENLILLGFSQGAMLSIHLGLTMKKQIKGVIALSGFAINPTGLSQKINSRPEIFILHGQSDPIVPFSFSEKSVDFFKQNSIPHEQHALPNLLHEIDNRVMQKIDDFLQRICN